MESVDSGSECLAWIAHMLELVMVRSGPGLSRVDAGLERFKVIALSQLGLDLGSNSQHLQREARQAGL